jgi:hypothetical protein
LAREEGIAAALEEQKKRRGKRIGEVRDRAIAMGWDIEKAGIYVSINYIGLLDEFALFGRSLTVEEVTLLHNKPDLLSPLKKKAAPQ